PWSPSLLRLRVGAVARGAIGATRPGRAGGGQRLERAVEAVEAGLPGSALLDDPALGAVQTLGSQRAPAPLPLARALDEPGLLEHAEVLGDRGPAHRERLGELPDGGAAGSEPLQHRAPGAHPSVRANRRHALRQALYRAPLARRDTARAGPGTPGRRVVTHQTDAHRLGDYPSVASEVVAELGPTEVEAAAVGPGDRVLDVAAGSGNAAIPAARRGAEVVATDLTPELLDVGRRDAEAEGLALTWQEADAEDLPFPDAAFDVVVSSVGVMFAPDHRASADELVRVLRPGGRLALVSW